MKIFYVSDARLPTEKAHGLQIMKTCEALARAGASVELIVPRRRNVLKDDPFAYYGIGARFSLTKVWTWDLVRYGRIGFLIQELTFGFSAAWHLGRKTAVIYSRDDIILWILLLLGFRNIIWESHTGGWNRAARVVARRARSLVVISEGLKAFYIEQGIATEKIVVIPSSFDPEQFAHPQSKEQARARLGIPLDVKVAMYIGRLDGWKGSDTFLEAAAHAQQGITFVVIGGEEKQLAAIRPNYPRVQFLGFRPYSELADNQSAADVLVVPNTGKDTISVRFTSPLKLIAHMASGRPIVASDLPSIREIVGNDGALLVPPDDATALAQGIERVLNDSALGDSLARAAAGKLKPYTWSVRAEKILALCTQAEQPLH